ncbi:MAG: Holliday junction branch migration protein RuvA [Actinobacteria bacterium]|nr:Holliday junction branch migration protein RuvA [Actinomycetota bacterium]
MIGSIRGVLAGRMDQSEVLVDVGGVGYRLTVNPSAATTAGAMGSEVFYYVHTHVRADAIMLYGFADESELKCFRALLAAQGVGPSLAMSVLSHLSPSTLTAAVHDDDIDTLCSVPGVGRKTAAKLVIDLKSRLDLVEVASSTASDPGSHSAERSARGEARAALVELGYRPDEIRKVLEGLQAEVGVEELLRLALRELATR